MGTAPRAPYNDALRLCFLPRTLQIPRLSEHRPIPLRCHSRLPLPPLRHTRRFKDRTYLPQPPHSLLPTPRGHNILPCIPFRICLPCAHRLHHLHPREIMQAAPCDVLAHYTIPEKLPPLQIPRRLSSYIWSGCIYAACWIGKI